MKWSKESVWRHNYGTSWKPTDPLANILQIFSGRASLAEGPRCEVEHFVAILFYIRVKASDAQMCPVLADYTEEVPQGIRSIESIRASRATFARKRKMRYLLCYCSIYIRYDNLVILIPQEDPRWAGSRSLKARIFNLKRNFIEASLQTKSFLTKRRHNVTYQIFSTWRSSPKMEIQSETKSLPVGLR